MPLTRALSRTESKCRYPSPPPRFSRACCIPLGFYYKRPTLVSFCQLKEIHRGFSLLHGKKMKGRDRVQLLLYTELYVLQCSDRDVTKLLPWEPHSAENYGGLTLDVGLFCASVSMKCPQVLASLLYRYQLVKGFIGMLYCWRVGKPTLQQCGSEIELCSHFCICWPSSYQPSFSTQLSLPLSLIL